jgi:hypothetical protein
MPRFEVTRAGAKGLPVGTVIEASECPAWLVGKCRPVDERVMEVATPTPQRGRPKKKQEEESPD